MNKEAISVANLPEDLTIKDPKEYLERYFNLLSSVLCDPDFQIKEEENE